MKWNRKQLLAALKAEGFTGDAKSAFADVEKFIAEKFDGKVADADGNEIDAKAAWDTVPPRRLSIPADQVEEKSEDKAVAVNKTVAVHTSGTSFARKAYEAKIKAGKAKFNDADTAEIVGAGLRLMTYTSVGHKGYAQAANDQAILDNAGLTMAMTADGLTLTTKAGSSDVNTLGGALVAPEFSNTLLWLSEMYGVSRSLGRVVNMRSDIWTGPRKTAIPTATFVGQGVSSTAQDVNYDNYSVIAKKAAIYVLTNSELEEDAAISIAEDLGQSFSEAFNKKLDECYFLGDGTTTYGGMLGLANGLPSGAEFSASGATWASITEADVNQLFQVQNIDIARGVFVCSRQFDMVVLNRLRAAKGGTTSVMFSGGQGLAGPGGNPLGPKSYYLGFPVYHAQVLPSVSAGTSKVLYFGDFASASTIGLRRDLTVKRSDSTALQTDQIATLATSRFGVNIQGDGRGSTVGPVALLKTT